MGAVISVGILLFTQLAPYELIFSAGILLFTQLAPYELHPMDRGAERNKMSYSGKE